MSEYFDGYADLTDEQKTRRKAKFINENPLPTAFYFKQRSEYFINKILVPELNVIDIWYRVEFQHRGSPHIHGLIWIKDAPKLNLKNEEMILQQLNEMKIFFDKFISTWHPNPEVSFSEKHPSKLNFTEIQDHEIDYNQSIRSVQIHTCKDNYCLRKKRFSNSKICRFRFPKQLLDESKIEIFSGKIEFTSKRNSSHINSHNRFILQQWRANMDIQPITSIDTVLHYIAKYASKSESSSEDMKSFIQQTVKDTSNQTTPNSVFAKILLHMCAERDYSSQKIFYVLMGWNLFSCSRSFVLLNFKRDDWFELQTNNNSNDTNTEEIPLSNPFETYVNRKTEYESLSLRQFYSSIYERKSNGKSTWSKRRISAIVRVLPKRKYDDKGDNEEYLKTQSILNIPWRNRNELNPNNQPWKDIHDRHSLNISDLNFIATSEYGDESIGSRRPVASKLRCT